MELTDTQINNLISNILEGKNYVNMDVDVRDGGRNAVKMTEDEFKQEMIHAYHMYQMEQEETHPIDLKTTPSPSNFVYKLAYKNMKNEDSKYAAKLYKDIWGGKYKFDSENVDCRGGIKMSSKGFPYLLCDAGGDWECPVCFFVYFDGKHFRGYIPLKGNAINTKTKSAFDGGDDYVSFNEKACIEDFLARVEVKGTYKKRDFTKDDEAFKQYRKKHVDEYKREQEERERQRAEEEKNMEPEPTDGYDINEMVSNILNKFVFEATATGTGGLPGEFTVPFPTDEDDPSLDRTPGDTCGMHDRVGKSNVGENKKRKKHGDFFEKHGIKKQTMPGHNVPSIGFSEKEQKWYGWSHRAIYGFGVGSKVKKGDCAYNGKEWTAKTLDDAKQMAIDFANDVS
jgi:hypothetical protein